MTWEEQFQRWIKAEDDNPFNDRPVRMVVIETRKAARNGGILDSSSGWDWVSTSLTDTERQTFLHAVFCRQAVPKHLVPMFFKMGIEERNPSNNRLYIEPVVKAIGAPRVMSQLTDLLRDGTDAEKVGALRAAYWVRDNDDERRYLEAITRFRDEMLQQFVGTDSTPMRQRIVPMLSMDPSNYSTEVSALIPNAINIARAHSDSYIRHRIEVQLGAGGPFRALPA